MQQPALTFILFKISMNRKILCSYKKCGMLILIMGNELFNGISDCYILIGQLLMYKYFTYVDNDKDSQ